MSVNLVTMTLVRFNVLHVILYALLVARFPHANLVITRITEFYRLLLVNVILDIMAQQGNYSV